MISSYWNWSPIWPISSQEDIHVENSKCPGYQRTPPRLFKTLPLSKCGHHSNPPSLQQLTSLFPPRCQVPVRRIHGLIQDWDAWWDENREPTGEPRNQRKLKIGRDTSKLQGSVQQSNRRAEKSNLHDVVRKDLQKNSKRFFTYFNRRKQEGFLQSDSSKEADILNDQFQSEYTQENTISILNKGPGPHPSMSRIKIGSNGVFKLLRDLNPHKAAGPDSIPTYILKVAAEEIASVLSKIFQTSLDRRLEGSTHCTLVSSPER